MKGFNMESIAKLGKMGLAAMNRNLPSVLSGAAIAGIVATVWTTYKAAPEVNSALDGAKWDKADKVNANRGNGVEEISADDVTLNAWETFKAVAPYVWKPAACVAFSATCVIAANVLNVQRLTMLAGAYKLSEKKLHEYEEKAKELLGEKKATELHDEVVKEMRDKPYDETTVIKTGKGDALFFDAFSGRYFRSSVEAIRTAENGVNQLIAEAGILDRHNKFVEVNHFYDTLGLDDIKFGNDFGWGDVECDRAPSLGVEITYDVQEIDGEQVAVGILDYEVGMSHIAFGDYFQDALR